MGSAQYKILYRPSAGGAAASAVTTSPGVTLSGLTPSTEYVFKIRNKCPGVATAFSTSGTFTTAPLRQHNLADAPVIYPNPGNGLLNMAGIEGDCVLNVYDITGALIKSLIVNNNTNIDLTTETEGMYFIEMMKNNEVFFNQKIVIVK